jgi:hypothetical protein
MVMLLYLRVQNSGKPLQGTVLVGAAAELVEDAVPLVVPLVAPAALPPIWVRLTERVVAVIWEFVEREVLLLPAPDAGVALELAVFRVTWPVTVA